MHSFAVTRRGFLGGGAAAAAAAALPALPSFAAGKPDSKFAGVQIGTITYSYRSVRGAGDAKKLLQCILDSGISSVELMGDVPLRYIGGMPRDFADAPMDKLAELRKMYNDAGVEIHIVKFGDIGGGRMSDAQIDFYFRVAKALGAGAITRELDERAAKRVAAIADKYKIYLAFHNHTQLRPTTYDGSILTHGKYLGINLDIGHFVAANDYDPLKMIEKYHSRIISVHMKDRTTKAHGQKNLPWGEGDTRVADILRMMRDRKYAFPADVELEYKIPQGSDAVKEVARCVAFSRKALLG